MVSPISAEFAPQIARSLTSARHRWLVFGAVLMGITCGPAVWAGHLVHTKYQTFFVPFTVDQTAGRPVADEYQLCVSNDRGVTWHDYQTRSSEQERFSFRAGRDDEYWFYVDRVGAPAAATRQPQLRVVVDSKPPVLDFEAMRHPDGPVELRWTASDPCLDANTVQFQYRLDPRTQWLPIPLELPNTNGYEREAGGAVKWWPPQTVQLEVQATVRDKCGNVGEQSKSLDITQLAVAPSAAYAGQPATPKMPENRLAQRTGSAGLVPTASDGAVVTMPQHTAGPAQPVSRPSVPLGPSPTPSPTPVLAPYRPQPLGAAPLAGQGYAGQPPASPNPAPTWHGPAHPAQAPRMTGSRRFYLDYEIREARSDNIESVEIWWTRDGGHAWEMLGVDEDGQSPFEVECEQDGVKGFSILVRPRRGVTPRPPSSGQPADVWIQVDSVKPSGRIVAARYGEGIHQGKLQIFWHANDRNLTAQPISLAHANTPQGPWQPIVDAVPNTGRYDWLVNQPLPGDIYLRLRVEDTAGNVGESILLEPISSHGLAPRGQIQGVRPAEIPRFRPTMAMPRGLRLR